MRSVWPTLAINRSVLTPWPVGALAASARCSSRMVPPAASSSSASSVEGVVPLEIVVGGCSNRKRKDETDAKYLGRQTHLHLDSRGLRTSALSAGSLPNLKTLYLFDNKIETLSGIGHLAQLTHLYGQNNSIARIGEDISGLTRLRKLYLNGNCLTSLEPLARLTALSELHVSSQRLASGAVLQLAPSVLAAMSSLRVLSLANNGIESTDALAGCRSLQTVDLTKNRLNRLAAIAPLLSAAPLVDLDLRGNPVANARQHLDTMVVACPTSRRPAIEPGTAGESHTSPCPVPSPIPQLTRHSPLHARPAVSRLNGRELTQSERPYLESLHRLGRRTFNLDDTSPTQPPSP